MNYFGPWLVECLAESICNCFLTVYIVIPIPFKACCGSFGGTVLCAELYHDHCCTEIAKPFVSVSDSYVLRGCTVYENML